MRGVLNRRWAVVCAVVELESGKSFRQPLLASKAKFQVLSQEYFDNFLLNFLEDAMADWEAEHMSDMSATEGENTDADPNSTAAEDSEGAALEPEPELEGEGQGVGSGKQEKKKKKKKKKKSRKSKDGEIDDGAGAMMNLEPEPEGEQVALLDAHTGVMTREDLSSLGSLMGARLTKSEIDKAMLEMDPTWVAAAGAEGEAAAAPGSVNFKAFDLWFKGLDPVTGEEQPIEECSAVLLKVRDAREQRIAAQ
jgi:hypothetical protein